MMLQELFTKYVNGTISPEEFSRLYASIQAGYEDEELDEVLKGVFANPAFKAGGGEYNKQEVFASLLTVMESKETQQAPVVPLKRVYGFPRIVAAAVLLFLLAGGIYLLQRKPEMRVVQQSGKEKFDASPGRSGAILTMANGQQVLLDSVENGMLEKQGNALVKKESGQISYQSVATASEEATALYNTITTPRGRQFKLVLSDGTLVMLNAASSIRYPTVFTGSERRVFISGEVYFDAAHDAKHPFKVACSKGEIEVLGTQFNVSDYSDEAYMDATLLEGAIQLGMGNSKLQLAPGQQGRIERSSGKMVRRQADTSIVTAWIRGMLALDGADLKGVVRQVSRWYDVDFEMPVKVPDVRIGGMIHRDVNLSVVLEFLEENGVHYTTSGKHIKLSP